MSVSMSDLNCRKFGYFKPFISNLYSAMSGEMSGFMSGYLIIRIKESSLTGPSSSGMPSDLQKLISIFRQRIAPFGARARTVVLLGDDLDQSMEEKVPSG